MIDDIGKKIKVLRTNNNLTLKDLSEKTSLSIGFLSQLERGLTTIAIDSLENIAKQLGVELSYFFSSIKEQKQVILRKHEQEVFQIVNSKFIHYHLTNDAKNRNLLPRLIEILPMEKKEHVTPYGHEGEEFVYVLEGILTLVINDEEHLMYPGDSAHYSSNVIHNWANYTSKNVKILVVSTPNRFKE